MDDRTVTHVRGVLTLAFKRIAVDVGSYYPHETELLKRVTRPHGTKVVEQIIDYALWHLGHSPPVVRDDGSGPTARVVRKKLPKLAATGAAPK